MLGARRSQGRPRSSTGSVGFPKPPSTQRRYRSTTPSPPSDYPPPGSRRRKEHRGQLPCRYPLGRATTSNGSASEVHCRNHCGRNTQRHGPEQVAVTKRRALSVQGQGTSPHKLLATGLDSRNPLDLRVRSDRSRREDSDEPHGRGCSRDRKAHAEFRVRSLGYTCSHKNICETPLVPTVDRQAHARCGSGLRGQRSGG